MPRPAQYNIITQDEFDDITSRMTPQFKTAMALMFYGGLRISEVLKVRWSDISLPYNESMFGSHILPAWEVSDMAFELPTTPTMIIRESKNLVTRTVIVDKHLRAILGAWIKESKPLRNAPVVPLRHTGIIYSCFKRNAERIGRKRLHPHDLRHSYATRLVKIGFPISEVQMLMGHKNIATTSIYLHPTTDDVAERYKTIGMM
jgi:integrase